MNEIAEKKVITEITVEEITKYLDSTGLTAQLNSAEKMQFIQLAQLYGLNPFKREIYCTVYGEGQYRKCTIVTGYEVYIKRAERTGKLDGWQVNTDTDGKIATITIWRKDWSHPFEHQVFYSEAVQTTRDRNGNTRPNAVWQKMPRFMLKKVAIGQGFRLCFADEFGGMPYEEAEMPQNDKQDIIVQPEQTTEIQKEVLQAIEKSDNASVLLDYINQYESYLSAPSVQSQLDALDWQDRNAVDAMLERVKTYLGKKGVAI